MATAPASFSNEMSSRVADVGSSAAGSSSIEAECEHNPAHLCDRPSCLGIPYHEWGACAPATKTTYEELLDSIFATLASVDAMDESTLELHHPEPAFKRLQRFAPALTDSDVVKAREQAIPKRTREDTAYCMRVWDEWAKSRRERGNAEIQPLATMDASTLQHWLTYFILEVRKQNGSEYPPNTLHHLICGIMRYVRQNGRPEVDFFKDPSFADFRLSLDAEMKRLQSNGLGSKRKQAEPLTLEEEEELWNKKVLGDHNPHALLNTVVFMAGLYFALHSGDEHRQLRHSPCQIQLIEKPGERPYLLYTEDRSKNNPGGLKGRKYKPKVVPHYGNTDNHSLRATAATRLYSSGIDEQLVMERTGHRSTEGIRSYKRTSTEQQVAVSDILNNATKKPCTASTDIALTNPPAITTTPASAASTTIGNISLPSQLQTSNTDHAGAFYLSSCSNVNISFYCSK